MEQTNYSSDGSMPGSTQDQSQGQATASDAAHGIADRARDIAGNTQEKLADVGSSMRDRAGHLKDSLADALDSGADKLRARGSSSSSNTQLAGAAGSASVAVDGNDRVTDISNRVAGGMEATADWLRDADLDGLKASVERQVKEHPGRTLLIAAGLGYLIGKAFKK
jgi:ElaB/YqjD/DUF883 family membrane-anchored ribosome-binding protein